jgi:hypothetical protein
MPDCRNIFSKALNYCEAVALLRRAVEGSCYDVGINAEFSEAKLVGSVDILVHLRQWVNGSPPG